MVLVGLEPEDEAGDVFLRLRKAVARPAAPGSTRSRRTPRAACASWAATWSPTRPGAEAGALVERSASDAEVALDGGAVILVGERLRHRPRRR